jgi:hypothetical protein
LTDFTDGFSGDGLAHGATDQLSRGPRHATIGLALTPC